MRQVLDAVVPEVAVELAVDREFFIVEGVNGGVRAFEVEGSKRPAGDFGNGLLNDCVEVGG
jgi:hypothetical protein